MKLTPRHLCCLSGMLLVPVAGGAAVLEEVVVTAQKREQALQDVGISVTALTGDQMQQLGYTNAQEVTALAPGVSTVQPNGEANYTIAMRGSANSDFTTNQEAPVAMYIDEVYISQASGSGFMLFDMERVEMLRGPQGTLFGRNATGGLVQFVTRKPSQEFDGYGQITLGEYEQVKFEGAVGGGLTDTLSARLSVATHHNSGYVENRLLDDDINNANDYAGRIQLLFEPNEDVDFLLNVRGGLQQIRTGFFEYVSAVEVGVLSPGVPNPDLGGYFDNDGDVFAGDYDRFGFNDLETYGITGRLRWRFSDMELVSITDYQSVERDYVEDSDASPVDYFNFNLVTDAEQWSQEIRLSRETDRMRWVTGFYYLDIGIEDSNGGETRGFFNNIGLGGFAEGIDAPYTTDSESWSLFGQVELDFLENMTAIFGFRWIEEQKEHFYVNNLVNFVPGTTPRNGNPNVVLQQGTYRGERDDGVWSARIQFDYRPSDDLLVYGSWNRGVKAGGFNAPFFPGGPQTFTDEFLNFAPEKLDAYEIGFKSTLFGGLARLNGSAYYYDYDAYQAFTIIGLDTILVNADDAKSRGFELELQATPLDGLDFAFGVGYIDAEITLPGATSTVVPVQTPEWNLNGLLRYEWPAFNGRVAIQSDFQYRSELYFALTNDEPVTEDGYAVANAALSWTSGNDQWTARLFVNNLTDEEYLVQTFDLSGTLANMGTFGLVEQYYGRPRWVGGSVTYRF